MLEGAPLQEVISESGETFSLISTDASEKGVGAILHDGRLPNLVAHSCLPSYLMGASSTARELYAILVGINSFKIHLRRQKVVVHTDSQVAAIIHRKGSTNRVLQKLAKDIWDTERDCSIDLKVVWVPRELNVEADQASRILDPDDWSISQHIFDELSAEWGPFSVDLFASEHNAKCSVFLSR